MKIEIFEMERMQSTWENVVEYNLSESGVHPLTLKELLTPEEIEDLAGVEIGYTQTNGTPPLRENIARLYPGAGPDQVLTTSGSSEANSPLDIICLDSRQRIGACQDAESAPPLTPNTPNRGLRGP